MEPVRGAGLDWESSVKALTAAGHGNASGRDLARLAAALAAPATLADLLHHSPDLLPFYRALVLLSSHFLLNNLPTLESRSLSTYVEAGKTIAQFLKQKLTWSVESQPNLKQYTETLEALSRGEGCLSRPQILTLTAELKSSSLPSGVRASRGLSDPQRRGEEAGRGDASPDAWRRSLFAAITAPAPTDHNAPPLTLKEEFSQEMTEWLITEGLGTELLKIRLEELNHTIKLCAKAKPNLDMIVSQMNVLNQTLKLKLCMTDKPEDLKMINEIASKCLGLGLSLLNGDLGERGKDATPLDSATKSSVDPRLLHILDTTFHGIAAQVERITGAHSQYREEVEKTKAEMLVRLTEAVEPSELSFAWAVDLVPDLIAVLHPQPHHLLLLLKLTTTLLTNIPKSPAVERAESERRRNESGSMSAPTSEDGTILGTWLEELLSSVPQLADHPPQSPQGLVRSLSREKTSRLMPATARRLHDVAQSALRFTAAHFAPSGYLSAHTRATLKESWTSEAVEKLIGVWAAAGTVGGESEALVGRLSRSLLLTSVLGEGELEQMRRGLCRTEEGQFPLGLGPQLLALLLQVVVTEVERGRTESAEETLDLVVKTLGARSAGGEGPYLSVELGQVAALIFNLLPDASRARALVAIAQAVTGLSPTRANPHVTHLLLLLEYGICCYANPLQLLLTQVEENVTERRDGETHFLRLGSIHVFLKASTKTQPDAQATFFDLIPTDSMEKAQPDAVKALEDAKLYSTLPDSLRRLVNALPNLTEATDKDAANLEWASVWGAYIMGWRLLRVLEPEATVSLKEAGRAQSYFQLLALAETLPTARQALTDDGFDSAKKLELFKDLLFAIRALQSARRAVVEAGLEAEGGRGEWEAALGVLSPTCPAPFPEQMGELSATFPQWAPEELSDLVNKLEAGRIGAEPESIVSSARPFLDLTELFMGNAAAGFGIPRHHGLIQFLADATLVVLADAPKPILSMVPSKEIADTLIPAYLFTGLSKGTATAVTLLERCAGENVVGQIVGLAWVEGCLEMVGRGRGKSTIRALLGALGRHVQRPGCAPVWAAVKMEAATSQLLRLWESEEGSWVVKSEEFLGLVTGCLRAAASEEDTELVALVQGLAPLLRSPDIVRFWHSEFPIHASTAFWEFANALLAFLNHRNVEWAGEMVEVVVGSVEVDLGGLKASNLPKLVKSGRWGYAQLKPVVDSPPLSSLQTALRLAVSFTQLQGGKALGVLLRKLLRWLRSCDGYLKREESLGLVKGGVGATEEEASVVGAQWDTACNVLALIGELVEAVRAREEGEEEEEEAEEEDDDDLWRAPQPQAHSHPPPEALNDSSHLLCTFTRTQKDFETQHWYHCHTCGMVAGEGVCTVCAKVCHASHDLSYAKFGSFFCDCGAKGEGACQALTRRSPQPAQRVLPPAPSPPSAPKTNSKSYIRTFGLKASCLSSEAKDTIRSILVEKEDGASGICEEILRTLSYVVPAVAAGAETASGSGAVVRRRRGLAQMLAGPLPPLYKNRILVPTRDRVLGLEKSGLALGGEESSTLRQLLQSRILRRVPLALLTPPNAPTFLALAQEKNRIMILPAAQLLSQLRLKPKKLNVMRCACESLNWTIVSVWGSGARVAACGLRDLSVLTILPSGGISDSFHLPIALETGNFIIKVPRCPCHCVLTILPSGGISDSFHLPIALETGNFIIKVPRCPCHCVLTILPSGGISDSFHLPIALETGNFIIKVPRCPCHCVLTILPSGGISDSFHLPIALETGNFIIKVPRCPCHCVLTILPSGGISDSFHLPIALETGNFIIKAVWLGEKELAVVTADFVNVYDLGTESERTSPKHHFLIPVGKIRDVAFPVKVDEAGGVRRWVSVGSSTGSVFLQELLDPTYYKDNGPFYLTDALDFQAFVGGSVVLSVASLHYSTSLRLLFASFSDGNTLVSTLDDPGLPPLHTTALRLSAEPDEKAEAVVCWRELAETPGLVIGSGQESGLPHLLFFTPDATFAHVPSTAVKAKPLHFLALHTDPDHALNSHSLAILLLAEDGELELFSESKREPVDFWRLPVGWGMWGSGQPSPSASTTSIAPPPPLTPNPNPQLPIDFFESCLPLNQISFGGPDVLEIYNKTQLKSRLLGNDQRNLHIASPKPSGFELEVENEDPETIICGLRVEVGKQGLDRAPKYIQAFGRQKQLHVTRHRWIDFPFTRREILSSSPKITIKFGGGGDGGTGTPVTVDAVKVYGKSRDAFGWETEAEGSERSLTPASPSLPPPPPLPQLLVAHAFHALHLYLRSFPNGSDRPKSATDLATSTLVANLHPAAQLPPKALLNKLFSSARERALHADVFVVGYVWRCLERAKLDRDPEQVTFLLRLLRDIAVHRPLNLHHALTSSNIPLSVSSSPAKEGGDGEVKGKARAPLVPSLVELVWALVGGAGKAEAPISLAQDRLRQERMVVWMLVEVVCGYARVDPTFLSDAAALLFRLLTCSNLGVAQSARLGLQSMFRAKGGKDGDDGGLPSSVSNRGTSMPPPPLTPPPPVPTSPLLYADQDEDEDPMEDHHELMEAVDAEILDADEMDEHLEFEGEDDGGNDGDELEALMAAAEAGVDPDDETAMLELAVALSLQSNAPAPPNNEPDDDDEEPGTPLNSAPPLPLPSHLSETFDESGLLSDTSGPLSEEEGSSAQPSARRPSDYATEKGPGRHPPSKESSSSSLPTQMSSRKSSTTDAAGDEGSEGLASREAIATSLLEAFLPLLLQLEDKAVSGSEAVAFLQTILLLLTHPQLPTEERFLSRVLDAVVASVSKSTLGSNTPEILSKRSEAGEVFLLKLRLVSVLLSRAKSSRNASSGRRAAEEKIARLTAEKLARAGLVPFARQLLAILYQVWMKDAAGEMGAQSAGEEGGAWAQQPDLSPFFQPHYVREFGGDLFRCYHQLLTEMALRLPYQIKKLVQKSQPASLKLEGEWEQTLCDLVSCQEVPFVRRQARKLLLLMAGSKEAYRVMRDRYSLNKHMTALQNLLKNPTEAEILLQTSDNPPSLILHYLSLSEILEHLKSVGEVGKGRARNWQAFLDTRDAHHLELLLWAACVADEMVGKAVTALLLDALASPDPLPPHKTTSTRKSLSKIKAEAKSKRKSSIGGDENWSGTGSDFSSELGRALVERLLSRRKLLLLFLRRSLLHANVAERRWLAHRLVRAVFRLASDKGQSLLLRLLWDEVWPEAASLGRRGNLVADLLGYYSVQMSPAADLVPKATALLTTFQTGLAHLPRHPNATLYHALSQVITLEGYYLESSPCFICEDPELPMQPMKLSAMKADSRWTTTAQMLKLSGSFEIAKVTLKMADLKRAKMIKTLRLYCSNKTFASAVELKSRTEDWELVREVEVSAGASEVRVEPGVPVVASALVLEVAAFHESPTSATELLHCPRCSATVPPNPGMCTNCGENVYQCHKCRTINYDEKDPFFCNSCGFSKYAKMEVTCLARPATAVEPIKTAEGRTRAEGVIRERLERAEECGRELRALRGQLETALLGGGRGLEAEEPDAKTPNASIRPLIHQLATKYSGEAQKAFAGLRRATQQINAQRREVMEYDARCGLPAHPGLGTLNTLAPSTGCFGCAEGTLGLLMVIIKALLAQAPVRAALATPPLISALRKLLPIAPLPLHQPFRELIAGMCRDNDAGTTQLCEDIERGVASALHVNNAAQLLNGTCEMDLLRSMLQMSDSCWQRRLQCVTRVLVAALGRKSPWAEERVALPCLQMLHNLLLPAGLETKAEAAPPPLHRQESIREWLGGEAMGEKPEKGSALEEKYGRRWLSKSGRGRSSELGWVESVLFSPHSLSLRLSTAALLRHITAISPQRHSAILELSRGYIERIGELGQRGAELMDVVKSLTEEEQWRAFLGVRGFLPRLATLLQDEVGRLVHAEEAGESGGVEGGFALSVIADLLGRLLEVPGIKRSYKAHLLGPVLQGYLALRLLLLQRTRLVQEAQERLLGLLEELTSGTEEERRKLAATCISTVAQCPPSDTRTPLFIFERLCDIIHPEKAEVGDFSVNIEKDAAQEDFLQGRMLGNPYSSSAPGIGPLMKDLKNKICRDCELVALLDDDNGRERAGKRWW